MPKKHSRSKCLKFMAQVPDMIVVEPSECDRWATNKLEDLVEGCWLVSRPPPVLYDRDPVVTARRAEVARYWISGDGDDPIYIRHKLNTCSEEVDPKSISKFHEQCPSVSPKISPRERLRSMEKKSI
ncbi:uncharacterized protein [Halyomorpha halys]|uniref:uncharacterized protein n=1 Tax=Halyomorpha halys TaxID=286706 RepID=UPI0034D1D0A0